MTFNELHEELTNSIPGYKLWDASIQDTSLMVYGDPVEDSTVFSKEAPLITIRKDPREGRMWVVKYPYQLGKSVVYYQNTKGLIKGVHKKLIAGVNYLEKVKDEKIATEQATKNTLEKLSPFIKEHGKEYFTAAGNDAFVHALGGVYNFNTEEETVQMGTWSKRTNVPLYLFMGFVKQVKTLQLIE